MSKLSEQIGQRLRDARKTARYKSARAFSSKHNIPETTYAQHETGKRFLGIETLMLYCRLLNINPGWLLTGQGEPYLELKNKSQESKLFQEISQFNQPQQLLAKQSLKIENLINTLNGKASNLTKQHQLVIKEFLAEMWDGLVRLLEKINE